METQRRQVRDAFGAIVILPWREFLQELWDGNLL
jgi:hypothetical protein